VPHLSVSLRWLRGRLNDGGPSCGELSLAHEGVLLLDDVTDFGPAEVMHLGQALKDKCVKLVSAKGKTTLPGQPRFVFATAGSCTCQPRNHQATPVSVERSPPVLRRRLGEGSRSLPRHFSTGPISASRLRKIDYSIQKRLFEHCRTRRNLLRRHPSLVLFYRIFSGAESASDRSSDAESASDRLSAASIYSPLRSGSRLVEL